jgi:hypothetical protein
MINYDYKEHYTQKENSEDKNTIEDAVYEIKFEPIDDKNLKIEVNCLTSLFELKYETVF